MSKTNQRKIAFVFPGQGAQYPGMGKDFYTAYSEARLVFEEADDRLHHKLSTTILEGPEDVLTKTHNSQAGIFVMSVSLLRVIQKLFPDLKPTFTAGLSLGEYTALTAADWASFGRTLDVVQARGKYMSDACEETKGTMAVVLGLDAPVVEEAVAALNLPHDLWVANYNCPGQIVISGTLKGIETGAEALKAKGAKRVLPLSVHGAFHSGLMRMAEHKLQPHIEELPLAVNDTKLVMNVTAKAENEPEAVRELLLKQVTHSVRWEQSMRFMAENGVELFIEIGCGKTLAGFHKRMGLDADFVSVEKVEDLDLLAKRIA